MNDHIAKETIEKKSDNPRCKGRGKRFFGIGLPILIAAGAVAFFAFNCHGPGSGMMTPERINKMITWKLNDVLDDIDATEEQSVKIHAIKDRLFNEGLQMHRENFKGHKDLLAEWRSPDPDLNKIDAFVEAKIEQKKAFSKKVIAAVDEIHDILNADQREAVALLVEEHLQQFEEVLNKQ